MTALVTFLVANWGWIGPLAGLAGTVGLSAAHARGYQLPLLSAAFNWIHNTSPSDSASLLNTLGGLVNGNLDAATVVSTAQQLLTGLTAQDHAAVPDLQAAVSHQDPAVAVQLLGGILGRLGQRRAVRRAALPTKPSAPTAPATAGS